MVEMHEQFLSKSGSAIPARPAFEDEAVQAEGGSRGHSPLAGQKGQSSGVGIGKGRRGRIPT
ncbi:hypothetical protein B9W62_33245 [Streptomyces sp. CS113]|nr:hypothetical protein B9W62_33245 [Streptomyces sp. CS113]